VASIADTLAKAGGASLRAADLQQRLAGPADAGAADPEELYALAEQAGYQIDLDWSGHGQDGAFDLVLCRRGDPGEGLAGRPHPASRTAPHGPGPSLPQARPWDSYVNGAARRRDRRLLPQLRTALRDKLPDYMLPSAFVFLDQFPLTPNGKIDRRALPAPDTSRRDLAPAYVAPRTATEAVIAGIWAEVLDLDQVGVLDDFFALGGHSLLSTRIVVRIREAFGVSIPLHQIFGDPTVAGLSRVLVERSDRPEVIEKTAEILVRLSGLSDDQVAQALDGTRPAAGTSGAASTSNGEGASR
jgi:hypothetical protein